MLTVYEINQNEEWDKVVTSFADHDVYWLSGYVKAFQIHGDGVPLLFFYEDSHVRGINVVMKRDIAEFPPFQGHIVPGQLYDFSTPYGYGGWIVEGGDSTTLFNEYTTWCEEHNIVSEFVRYHPLIGNHKFSKNVYDVLPLGRTVAMDLRSPDVIWENITSKNRNVIRKAQKNNVRIFNGSSPELYESFRQLYNGTMDRDDAASYYYFGPAFYESIYRDLNQNARLFYAVYEEKLIAASIILTAGDKMNYHLSGSLREFSALAPTNLLLYEAALWGSKNGFVTFHLGGGLGSQEDSLFKFKKAFYRLEESLPTFHIGRKILNQAQYNQLVAMRADIPEDNGFFPAYRA